jgi:hypothetical protein
VKTITKEPFRKWFEGEEAIKQKLKWLFLLLFLIK